MEGDKMKIRILVFVIAAIMFISCDKGEEANAQGDTAYEGHKVTVVDVLQANSYTYLQVEENGAAYWMAVLKMDAEKGQTLYYPGGMMMSNFQSKDLDRTFEQILFVSEISASPNAPQMSMGTQMMGGNPHTQASAGTSEISNIKVEPAVGGITIAQLYEGKASFAGKTVKIRGQVTKYNPAIMGKNWVHLQDGTGSESNNDITITTDAEVAMGHTVTFEGVIVLDKDFGAGYRYNVIMEQARLVD
jgi:hypothetical protein